MDNTDENLPARRKALAYTLITALITLFACQWWATQSVAEDCGYNPLLGGNLHIGESVIYPPWGYFLWSHDPKLMQVIPDILAGWDNMYMFIFMGSMVLMYFLMKNMRVSTEHGSAAFATEKDIVKSDLGMYASKNGGVFEYKKIKKKFLGLIPVTIKKKIIKNSGVVVGINPFTHRLMLHDGVEHILLMAPTRSGKGVCTIVPTGLIWKHSIFFFDPKGELWGLTSGYRKKVLHQKVLKFQPLCTDGSAARWNPLAEINYRTYEEISDVQSIVATMVRPDGEQKGGDDFWPNSAAALLNGIILHLLYSYDKEHRPLPCPTDVMSFLSSPGKTLEALFTDMRDYPHISPEEFLELPYKDENGNEIRDQYGIVKRHKNPLKEIYGDYIKDYRPFTKALKIPVHSIEEIRLAILHKIRKGETIVWDATQDGLPSGNPYHMLLTHPKVAESASNMLNGADQTRASIMQTAQTALAIYQNPVVQRNMAVSDFAIRDLLDPAHEVSLYLVMEVKDIQTVKPIARLFIQLICSKLIRDMKFGKEAQGKKKQRLLLMLDEFPQLGNMQCIELALAICAGYGIKMCIVAQDVNQLNKAYTKDNSIGSNCHLHIYFTPNIDSGGATAKSISETLGKKTIKTVSHSDGGGGFFKGSDSTSSTGRELMTADEVSHMSSEKELVFVAGHKAIMGDKLRYYTVPFLLKRTQIEHPAVSDPVTAITNYDELFAVHAADEKEREHSRMFVLASRAKKQGMTLAEFLQKKERERLEYEESFLESLDDNTKTTKSSKDHNGSTQLKGTTQSAQAQSGRTGKGSSLKHTPYYGRHSVSTKARNELTRENEGFLSNRDFHEKNPNLPVEPAPSALHSEEDYRTAEHEYKKIMDEKQQHDQQKSKLPSAGEVKDDTPTEQVPDPPETKHFNFSQSMDNLLNKQPAQNEGLSAEPPAQSGQEVPKDEQKAPAEQENTLDTPQAAEEKTDTGTADGQSELNLFDIINKKDEN